MSDIKPKPTVGRPALYGKTMRQLSVAVSPEHENWLALWREKVLGNPKASDAAVVRSMLEFAWQMNLGRVDD